MFCLVVGHETAVSMGICSQSCREILVCLVLCLLEDANGRCCSGWEGGREGGREGGKKVIGVGSDIGMHGDRLEFQFYSHRTQRIASP